MPHVEAFAAAPADGAGSVMEEVVEEWNPGCREWLPLEWKEDAGEVQHHSSEKQLALPHSCLELLLERSSRQSWGLV